MSASPGPPRYPPGASDLAALDVGTTWHGGNITKFQHRVPDVAVVRADSFEVFFQETPPALVVEVASPRTQLYDRNRKKDVYQGFGIPAYWIVEPDRDRTELTVFELRSGAYKQAAHVTGDEEYRAVALFPVTIVPSKLITVSSSAGARRVAAILRCTQSAHSRRHCRVFLAARQAVR